MATVLGLIAVLGVVWLVKSATTGSQNTSGSGTDTSAAHSTATSDATDGGTTGSGDTTGNTTGSGQPTGNATGDGQTTGNTTGSGQTSGSATGGGGHTPGGGKTPGEGGRSIKVNGVRLDGANDHDGCVMFKNPYATTAHIESVSFSVTDGPEGPGNPALKSDNAAHCSRGSGCDGARLVTDGKCEAGAVLPSDAPSGDYTINAVAAFTFLCDNATTDPCKHALESGGPPPTPKNPVLLRASSSMPTDAFGEGPEPGDSPPNNPPQPVNPPPGDTPTTPTAPVQ